MKLPSKDDIQDILAQTDIASGIDGIVAALEDRYPWSFRPAILHTGVFRPNVGLYHQDGQKVTDSVEGWVALQIVQCGGLKQAVDRWAPEKLVRSQDDITTHLITAQIGQGDVDLLMIQIDEVQERAAKVFASNSYNIRDEEELVEEYYGEADATPTLLGSKRYTVDRVDALQPLLAALANDEHQRRVHFAQGRDVTIRSGKDGSTVTKPFLEVYPDYLDHKLPIMRLLEDWGALVPSMKFGVMWDVDVRAYTDHEAGRVVHQVTPRPANLADIPSLDVGEGLWDTMKQCEKIDKAAGFRFAWFFHAVYGNRFNGDAIRIVGEGLQQGKIDFDPTERAVLERWMSNSYCF